ncbi:peroxiredoxin [Streptomyces sp. NBC_00448]|uniref:peroxiredoxin n=1 Tax=Streptomyces sp. NBC_00448 TaxID=2903652 RepID=UPI002E23BAAB
MPIDAGGPAPDLRLKDQHGRTVALDDFRGVKNVLLIFFPFAFTSVCSGELQAIQNELASFQNERNQVLAVSCDSMHALRAFSDAEGLDFPLLSDFWPHGTVSRAYGVFAEEKGCALRGTFVIDRQGMVRWTVVNGLPDARDLGQYAKALSAL